MAEDELDFTPLARGTTSANAALTAAAMASARHRRSAVQLHILDPMPERSPLRQQSLVLLTAWPRHCLRPREAQVRP